MMDIEFFTWIYWNQMNWKHYMISNCL